jgi:hypothetical protein
MIQRTFMAMMLLVAATGVARADGWVVQATKLPMPDGSGPTLELKSDGTVLAPDGKTIGKAVGHELRASDGSVLLRETKDGAIEGKSVRGKLAFTSADELAYDGGKLWFDDAGALTVQRTGKPAQPSAAKLPALKGHARRLPLLIYYSFYLVSSPR